MQFQGRQGCRSGAGKALGLSVLPRLDVEFGTKTGIFGLGLTGFRAGAPAAVR